MDHTRKYYSIVNRPRSNRHYIPSRVQILYRPLRSHHNYNFKLLSLKSISSVLSRIRNPLQTPNNYDLHQTNQSRTVTTSVSRRRQNNRFPRTARMITTLTRRSSQTHNFRSVTHHTKRLAASLNLDSHDLRSLPERPNQVINSSTRYTDRLHLNQNRPHPRPRSHHARSQDNRCYRFRSRPRVTRRSPHNQRYQYSRRSSYNHNEDQDHLRRNRRATRQVARRRHKTTHRLNRRPVSRILINIRTNKTPTNLHRTISKGIRNRRPTLVNRIAHSRIPIRQQTTRAVSARSRKTINKPTMITMIHLSISISPIKNTNSNNHKSARKVRLARTRDSTSHQAARQPKAYYTQ